MTKICQIKKHCDFFERLEKRNSIVHARTVFLNKIDIELEYRIYLLLFLRDFSPTGLCSEASLITLKEKSLENSKP